MAATMSNTPEEKPAAAKLGRFTWRTFLLFWLLSLLLLCSSSRLPGEKVRILDARHEVALLSNTEWVVPALKWDVANVLAEIPYWFFAVAGSLLISLLAWSHISRTSLPVILLLIFGLSLKLQPEYLIPGVILLVMIQILNHHYKQQSQRWKILLVAAVGIALSVLLTIEFGFIALYCFLMLMPDFIQHGSQKLNFSLPIAALFVVAIGTQVTGFFPTAFRPLSWLTSPYSSQLLPSTRSLYYVGHATIADGLLVLFLLYFLLKTVSNKKTFFFPLLLFPLGVACTHYLWLTAFSIAAGPKPEKSFELPSRTNVLILSGCLLFGAIQFASNAGSYTDALLGDATSNRYIDPAKWSCRGRVMLMDLEQSNQWQSESIQRKYTLLLDDRWETCSAFYPQYARFSRDLNEGRADSYLLSDDSWGGYKRGIKAWSPSLLVTSSQNLQDIRRLSLSPHWSLLGIDSQRTIFGLKQDRTTLRQAQQAYSLLTHLEWPRGNPNLLPENTIQATTWKDSLQVSKVLCAMRFPYAALRYLPAENGIQSDKQKTWCLLEISHRVSRHTGEASLLDQYRAIRGILRSCSQKSWPAEELLRAAQSLEILSAHAVASQLAQKALDVRWPYSLNSIKQRQANIIIENSKKLRSNNKTNLASQQTSPESKLREALKQGDEEVANQQLLLLAEHRRAYYAFLISSPNRQPTQLYVELNQLLVEKRIPQNFRAEAWFYLGCLALEAGDTQSTIAAMQESKKLAPNSAYEPIRELYLRQLGR